jgi:hypothetical protein
VVAPAYVVEGNRVYVKQLVFTDAGHANDHPPSDSRAAGDAAQVGAPQKEEMTEKPEGQEVPDWQRQAMEVSSDRGGSSAGPASGEV